MSEIIPGIQHHIGMHITKKTEDSSLLITFTIVYTLNFPENVNSII